MFWLRTGSAVLLEDKKRCIMVSDEWYVICDSRVGEDVAHFLVGCGEFARVLLVMCAELWCPASG